MKYYFSLLACLVSFIAHAQTTYSYRVEGELTDNSFNGKMLYIMRYDDNRYIDSTRVENQKFAFEGRTAIRFVESMQDATMATLFWTKEL